MLKSPYYNADIFKVLRAAYNRMVYTRGDRKSRVVRRYCAWLQRTHPHIYAPHALPTSRALTAQLQATPTIKGHQGEQPPKTPNKPKDHKDSQDDGELLCEYTLLKTS